VIPDVQGSHDVLAKLIETGKILNIKKASARLLAEASELMKT
jgi:hypothetical protein